jgi:hypothetical protein
MLVLREKTTLPRRWLVLKLAVVKWELHKVSQKRVEEIPLKRRRKNAQRH